MKYVALRVDNPTLRLRSDCVLGPRVTVLVTEKRTQGLEQPEVWFVESQIGPLTV